MNSFPDFEKFLPIRKPLGSSFPFCDARELLACNSCEPNTGDLLLAAPRLNSVGRSYTPFNAPILFHSHYAVVASANGLFSWANNPASCRFVATYDLGPSILENHIPVALTVLAPDYAPF
jgi:hypothetical protein